MGPLLCSPAGEDSCVVKRVARRCDHAIVRKHEQELPSLLPGGTLAQGGEWCDPPVLEGRLER